MNFNINYEKPNLLPAAAEAAEMRDIRLIKV